MPIKVDWTDPNSGTEEYLIYRSESRISSGSLPAPLATVPAGTFTYSDNTAVRNKLYFYRVGQKKGADITLTPNKALANTPYTGPGPQNLLRGDWEFGYFGRVPLNDIFSIQELRLIHGSITTAGQDNTDTTLAWLKFAVKGKIIFVASSAVIGNITWDSLYKAGVIYGNFPSSDWPAYIKTTYGVIPQGKIATKGEHQFVVRVPTSRGVMSNTGSAQADYMGGEYDTLIPYAYNARSYPDTLGYKNVDDMSHPSYICFSTDIGASNFCLNRGTSGSPDLINVSLAVNNIHPQHAWKPLLELIL